MFCNCVANYTKPYCNTFQCTGERSGEVHLNLVISDTFARFFSDRYRRRCEQMLFVNLF